MGLNNLIKYFHFLLLVTFLWSGMAMSAQIEGVRVWTAPDHTRLVFDIDQPVKFKYFTLKSPDRLVVDFEKSSLSKSFKDEKVKDTNLSRMRHAPRGNKSLRIVLDLKHPLTPKPFLLKPNNSYGHRFVLDLYSNGSLPEKVNSPIIAKTLKTNKSAKPKVIVRKLSTTKPVVAKASIPRKLKISKSEKDIKKLRDVVVAVDAGHGGEDPGAAGSVKHTREKNVTLQLARRMKRLIDAQPGMRAVLTRKGDYYVGLRQRMVTARKAKADLFVSLHADAFKDKRVRGSSVYVLSSRGATSEAARWLAAKENSSDLVGGVSLDDKDDVLASVLLDLSQSATQHASLAAARGVFKKLGTIGKVHGRKVQSAGFLVLKSPDIPSMLVETGFISNPAEERNLINPKYQEKMAKAVMQGLLKYFRDAPPPGTLLAKQESARKPSQHVIGNGDTLSHIADRYSVDIASLRRVNRINNDKRIRVGQILDIPKT